MTEDEAKTKWCPLAREMNHTTGPASTNRRAGGAGGEFCFCLASGCMAWGWEDNEEEFLAVDYFAEEFAKPSPDAFKVPEGEGWRIHGEPFQPTATGRHWRLHFKRSFGARRRGFCGLARRSEVVVTMP